MTSTNPWLDIPLEDYERHMSHPMVGQAILLNSLTKKYLDDIKPETAVFLGIAGGNGLEHHSKTYRKYMQGGFRMGNIDSGVLSATESFTFHYF